MSAKRRKPRDDWNTLTVLEPMTFKQAMVLLDRLDDTAKKGPTRSEARRALVLAAELWAALETTYQALKVLRGDHQGTPLYGPLPIAALGKLNELVILLYPLVEKR